MKLLGRLLPALLLIVAAVSCETVTSDDYLSLELKEYTAGKDAGSVGVVVRASGAWDLKLDFGSEEPWAKLTHSSGTGYKSNIKLNFDENMGSAARSLYVIVSTENDAKECIFTQTADGAASEVSELVDRTDCGWLELPETKYGDGLRWGWHSMTTNSRKERNWSFYWSSDDHLSFWVAYPLNKGLIGSGSRTNAWENYDPLVPVSEQACTPNGGFGSGYDRGHQLPSADRLWYDGNVQTFYPTNMTPQRSRFNQYLWAELESTVRTWAGKLNSATDTLYVVTGCVVDGSTTSRQAGRNGPYVTVPTAYYKALLRYTRSSGYAACGIWLDHDTNASSTTYSDMMSISELEKKTGINFFVNLPAKVGAEKAAEIESKAPTSSLWPL